MIIVLIWQHLACENGAIDELEFGFGNHFLIDDIRINEASTPGTELKNKIKELLKKVAVAA